MYDLKREYLGGGKYYFSMEEGNVKIDFYTGYACVSSKEKGFIAEENDLVQRVRTVYDKDECSVKPACWRYWAEKPEVLFWKSVGVEDFEPDYVTQFFLHPEDDIESLSGLFNSLRAVRVDYPQRVSFGDGMSYLTINGDDIRIDFYRGYASVGKKEMKLGFDDNDLIEKVKIIFKKKSVDPDRWRQWSKEPKKLFWSDHA